MKKIWFKHPNKLYYKQQEEIENGVIFPQSELIPIKDVDLLTIQVNLFTKENHGCNFQYYIEGSECERGFYLTVPWLLHLHVAFDWNPDKFKEHFPIVYDEDHNLRWGFLATRHFLCLKWNYNNNDNGKRKKSFYFNGSWRDVFWGKLKSSYQSPSLPVLEMRENIITDYAINQYPSTVEMYPLSPETKSVKIKVPLVVYKVKTTLIFERWKKVEKVHYEVAARTGIIVPRKKENALDRGDEIIHSQMDYTTGHCQFICEAKNPTEAGKKYITHIENLLK